MRKNEQQKHENEMVNEIQVHNPVEQQIALLIWREIWIELPVFDGAKSAKA